MVFPGFAFNAALRRGLSHNRLDWCGLAGQDRTMAAAQNPPLTEAIAGALEWWREAGVDCAFVDEPVSWLAEAKVAPAEPETPPSPALKAIAPPAAPPPVPEAPRFDPATIPASLEAFQAWWMSEPALGDGSTARRVPPRGAAGADLMVLVPEPESEDRETLLSGPQGKLLDAMVAAFGLTTDRVYFASALPRHLPGADWDAITRSGFGAAVATHVALVAPKRLIVFGQSVLPLLSHDPPQQPADLREFNHEGGNVPMLACRSLAALLEQPRWKARVWQAWLELTG
jgi:uracil-DNA glycosylase